MPDKPKKSNITVEKAFDILMSFGESRQEITAPEVSERFGLPRSTAYRYLATLKSYGCWMSEPAAGTSSGRRSLRSRGLHCKAPAW
ncbi:helix-turn-helix domain-containing protein [Pseudomonas yamanorum]|uniref:helix-turn-helix domain-containing protein n=1 Tax=Pseudomonas yamanorum TaxID=515393 RepID=UPI003D36E640